MIALKTQKKEEIDKILATSKSVSYADFLHIKNVFRVVYASSFVAMSRNVTLVIYTNAFKEAESQAWQKTLLNMDMLGGFVILVLGFLSSSLHFKGRRITIIFICLIVVVMINILWLAMT